MQLSDGRQLGYAFYGDLSSKRSIVYLHGLPGSRVEALEWDDVASSHGIRVIGLDRPGYGLSTLNPSRTLSQYPEDVLSLVNHLNLDTFAVTGSSGGGPYALSCARSIPPTRLKSVGVIGGLAPPDIAPLGAELVPRTTRYLLRYFPNLIAQLTDSRIGKLARMEDPVPLQEMWYKGFVGYKGVDQDLITTREYSNLLADIFREAFRQGWKGFAYDGKLLTRKWDLQIEDIQHPRIAFHYGDKDVHTPPHMGIEMSKRVKGSIYVEYKDAAHLSLVHVHGKEIMGEIIKHL